MNTTTVDPLLSYTISQYYVVCPLSTALAFMAVVTCIFIVILVWRTKSRLHTVNHLLMCNTCCASVLYCVAIVNGYGYLIFGQWQTSDMSCRWRAYFAYSGIAGIVYSYLLQAISRYFFAILSTKYRWLTSFKTHYILIIGQWVVVFLLTSPSIITQDINFYPKVLCWVPFEHLLHVAYTIFAYYIIPVTIIVIIYIYIYYRVRQETKNVTRSTNKNNSQKRDLQLLRNIIILLSIYLGGAVPNLLFQVTSIKLIYLISLVTLTLTVFIEKICMIFIDRELRHVIQSIIHRRTAVVPFTNTLTAGVGTVINQNNNQTVKLANVQSLQADIPAKSFTNTIQD